MVFLLTGTPSSLAFWFNIRSYMFTRGIVMCFICCVTSTYGWERKTCQSVTLFFYSISLYFMFRSEMYCLVQGISLHLQIHLIVMVFGITRTDL